MTVSIYIPTKDRAQSLRVAAESALAQSYDDIEVVIVNDGSGDDTGEYLRGLSHRDPRVKVISNKVSVGAAAARNQAILASSGEFSTGLDDDDLFLENRVASFVDYWNLLHAYGERPAFLYALDYTVGDGDDRRLSRKIGHVRFEDMFEHNRVGNQIFCPRSHFIDAGLFDPELPALQDLELFMRMLKLHGPGRLLDIPTYVFDVSPRDGRISRQSRHKLDRAFEIVSRRHAADSPRRRQQLFLQLFSEFYGRKPSATDFVQFFSHGLWLRGAMRLLSRRLSSRVESD